MNQSTDNLSQLVVIDAFSRNSFNETCFMKQSVDGPAVDSYSALLAAVARVRSLSFLRWNVIPKGLMRNGTASEPAEMFPLFRTGEHFNKPSVVCLQVAALPGLLRTRPEPEWSISRRRNWHGEARTSGPTRVRTLFTFYVCIMWLYKSRYNRTVLICFWVQNQKVHPDPLNYPHL